MFKKSNKRSSINHELISDWSKLCNDNGLSPGQVLGCAYHSTMISTIIASVDQNTEMLRPIENVISDIGLVSSEGANVLYIYREYYWLGSNWNEDLKPFHFKGLPDDFFDEENPYTKYFQKEFGFFLKSRVSLLLLQRVGKILEDYKITIEQSFKLGHGHANFLLLSPISVKPVLFSNIFSHYSAEIIDYLPQNSFKSPINNLWLFSKIFYRVIRDEFEADQEFQEWLWYFHNAIFFENIPGSEEIKPEWSINDPKFMINMLDAILSNANAFYSSKPHIGKFKPIQDINFSKWEEFFPLLHLHLKEKYKVKSPNYEFINTGEVCNFYAFNFIAAAELVLSIKE